ncbi:uncharacterized protein LTR77_010943 [Saxophila tyrrhenica]|uniref:Uncharacterized protein n=1 Tax=Saxophila tyrrhenica TaxID=1690608 RepID=A0AAV9NVY3_9PEZI|nr:hypothetical protein LTR77_010943 [Saxophila tyrrhenica]
MAPGKDYSSLGAWVVIHNSDLNIDRHKCHRVVPMQVLCLGAPRTGTFSMQEALAILGYQSPYHYSSVFSNVQDADMWQEALQYKFHSKGKPIDWRKHFDKLLGHSAAITDAPAVLFWQELLDAYPGVKVVLVERDEERWYQSMEVLLEGLLNPVGRNVIRFTDPLWFGRISNLGAGWIEALFGSRKLAEAKSNARKAYRKHYAEIRAGVPKERMLEFELSSGWAPLCTFLEKPVPKVPFPRLNEAAALENAFGAFIVKALKHSAFNLAVGVAIVAISAGAVWRWLG